MEDRHLDHVAIRVQDRDALAADLVGHAGMRVIQRTGDFTLVGHDARGGKLTLFPAPAPPRPGALRRIEMAGDGPARELPLGPDVTLALVPPNGHPAGEITRVVIGVRDPAGARDALARLGLGPAPGGVWAAGALVEITEGGGAGERPVLDHLGIRVPSARDALADATRRGLPVRRVVDAPNTIALFLEGPEGVTVELVEHKPGFALT